MKRILTSYRWRRRFIWLTATLLVVGGLVAAGLKWNTVASEPRGPSNVPAQIDAAPPKPVKLKHRDEQRMLAVVSEFIDTAVARKHVDRSWKLASSELRAGYSRKQWDTGEMPVIPYEVGSAKFRLEYADTEGVGLSIALFPPKGSDLRASDFLIGLHPLGLGKRRHWVVDYWQSVGGGGAVAGVATGGRTAGPPPRDTTARESRAWLLLPAALLSLIVLIPLGVASTGWYRTRRAERAFLRP